MSQFKSEPDQPGYWWCRTVLNGKKLEWCTQQVVQRGEFLCVAIDYDGSIEYESIQAMPKGWQTEWSGPIPEPTEQGK